MGSMIGACLRRAGMLFSKVACQQDGNSLQQRASQVLKILRNTSAIVAGNAGVNIDELVVSAGSMEGALKREPF